MVIDVHTHLFESSKMFPKIWVDELTPFKAVVMGEEKSKKRMASRL